MTPTGRGRRGENISQIQIFGQERERERLGLRLRERERLRLRLREKLRE